MKDLICDEFQNTVDNLLIRHHSILDIISKLSEATCRVNRSVIKTVTDCGCVSVQAQKIQIPDNIQSIAELKSCLDNHLRGQLCPQCEEVISSELGKLLFYTAALCNTLDINLYDVFIKEQKKASALGVYNFR
ncbi:Uncharacterized [Syntrophomonas zehnderi OL-4]|uniref:Uncharacterized n=1 Tax=Syntrophomonas zehnderi OL-4 TaxID=690567 RepID=A0A0E4G922_9FIRM|nr:hypothetical protein [Syntrophomonas zehnderi]CFX03739.1 Uncharacterized [Syntrophomonas zehnderi OL-4]